MSLVVTGSIGIDTVHTPRKSAERVLGGSCAYFAASASLLSPVRLVAAVGDDWPDEHAAILERFDNIDLAGLERRKGSKTFEWTGRYHENMNMRETIEVHVNVLGEAPPPVPKAFADSKYIFLANTDPGSQLAFLNEFPDRKFAVADTMDLWIETQRDNLEALLKKLNGLVLNDSEASLMTEIEHPVTAARHIQSEFDLDFVLVKKGEHGAVLVHQENLAVLPAFPCEEVVDPTGAGDSFAGGMMAYLAAEDRTDFEALQIGMATGTAVASFVIESFSLDRLANLTRKHLDERLAKFAGMVRVT